MSGYVVDTDIFGDPRCVSGDSYCRDLYGFGADYDSSSKTCGCGYGYELSYKSYGSGLECKSCSLKYGAHSHYNSLQEKCECDDDYTLDDSGTCVEKQHNVYFNLLALDEDEDIALVQSEYTGETYLLEYGIGCFFIDWYVGDRIVINLGTDYDVDLFDTIVLPDHGETCDIWSVDRVTSGPTTFFIPTTPSTPSAAPSCPDLVNGYLGTDGTCYCNSGYIWDGVNSRCIVDIYTDSSGNESPGTEEPEVSDIVTDEDLIERVSGKILLQVESVGEAWYLNPDDGKRYYMKDGAAAFSAMRNFALGITDADIEKIARFETSDKADAALTDRLRGKILLQVEQEGDAWYVNPDDGKRHFMGKPDDAYQLMRNLGLGITNSDLAKIPIGTLN